MSLSELFNRLRTKGPVSTLQSVLSVVEDIRFDRRYQLDTSAEVAIRDLDISDGDRRHADKYKPTRVRYFHRLMRRIELPPGGVFVDVGCGKGRVLLLASRYPFDQVIGLEISPTLSEVAERNVRAYRHYYPDGCPVRVECVNILDYEMSGAETVFFLYSPFDREVTKTFLENLSRSIKEQPRDLWLIIDEFRFPDLLDDSAELQIDGIYEYGAAVFHIYRHKDMS